MSKEQNRHILVICYLSWRLKMETIKMRTIILTENEYNDLERILDNEKRIQQDSGTEYSPLIESWRSVSQQKSVASANKLLKHINHAIKKGDKF